MTLPVAPAADLQTWLRMERARRGWSQLALARACGLHRTTVNALEIGGWDVSLRTLTRVCLALGYRPEVSLMPPFDVTAMVSIP